MNECLLSVSPGELCKSLYKFSQESTLFSSLPLCACQYCTRRAVEAGVHSPVRSKMDALRCLRPLVVEAASCLQVASDGTHAITSSKDKTAKLIDMQTLQVLRTYKHNKPVNSAAMSPLNHVRTTCHTVWLDQIMAVHWTPVAGGCCECISQQHAGSQCDHAWHMPCQR
jgi:WD40 repeat protein